MKPIQQNDDAWTIVQSGFDGDGAAYWESVFALSNGYLGMRGAVEEEDSGVAQPGLYINGFYELEPVAGFRRPDGGAAESQIMLNLCDVRLFDIFVNGERVRPNSTNGGPHIRVLDMKRGVLRRRYSWHGSDGARLNVVSERLISLERPHNLAMRLLVDCVDQPVDIRIVSRIAYRSYTRQFGDSGTRVDGRDQQGTTAVLEFSTPRSGLRYAACADHRVHYPNASCRAAIGDREARFEVEAGLGPGEPLLLEKHVAMATTLEEPNPAQRARRELRAAMTDGFDCLVREQSRKWQSIWDDADISVEGNAEDQRALRFSLFQLYQNHPGFDHSRSIPATGLTGANYMGWVFWDTEMYMNPCFVMTQPGRARALLRFRIFKLDHARRTARELGRKGALYPWSTINGSETNFDTLVSTAQYHINADLGYAVWQYWNATGDDSFLFHEAAEMLFETARFIADVGAFVPGKKGKYCVNTVCGPDEYAFPVNNNCYTNSMFAFHLSFALHVHALMMVHDRGALDSLCACIGLSRKELDHWAEVADRMYIPYDHGLGIHLQDDTYLGRYPFDTGRVPRNRDIKREMSRLSLTQLQVTKQADVVLLMHTRGSEYGHAQIKANYDFYEPRTVHASSLSHAIHGLVALRIGYSDQAYRFFGQSARMDLGDIKGNACDGIHLAAAGGTWMMAVMGYGGVRCDERGLCIDPRLPPAWSAMRFRIRYRGRTIEVTVRRGGTDLRLIAGEPVQVQMKGTAISLDSSGYAMAYSEVRRVPHEEGSPRGSEGIQSEASSGARKNVHPIFWRLRRAKTLCSPTSRNSV